MRQILSGCGNAVGPTTWRMIRTSSGEWARTWNGRSFWTSSYTGSKSDIPSCSGRTIGPGLRERRALLDPAVLLEDAQDGAAQVRDLLDVQHLGEVQVAVLLHPGAQRGRVAQQVVGRPHGQEQPVVVHAWVSRDRRARGRPRAYRGCDRRPSWGRSGLCYLGHPSAATSRGTVSCFRSGISPSSRSSPRRAPVASSRSARCGARPPCACSTCSGPSPRCTSSTRCRCSTRRSTRSSSRAATCSTATSATTCCRTCRRWTPRSSTATTTGSPCTTSCTCCSDVARKADQPLPLMVLHDVGWPYGRRDLYYAPEQIPDEFRQPYAQGGHAPGRQRARHGRRRHQPDDVQRRHEGGPRNGVMTAVDDFIAEYDRPVRAPRAARVLRPGDRRRAGDDRRRTRRCAKQLDRLESVEGQADLAEAGRAGPARGDDPPAPRVLHRRAAHARLGPALPRHPRGRACSTSTTSSRSSASTSSCGSAQTGSEPLRREPPRSRPPAARRRRASSASSAGPGAKPGDDDPRHYFPLTRWAGSASTTSRPISTTIREEAVVGDLVECGPGRGGGGCFMRGFLDAHAMPFQRVFVADEFRAAPAGGTTDTMGVPDADGTAPGGPGFPGLGSDLDSVRDAFERFGLLDDRVRFLQGPFEQTLAGAPTEKVALLRLGETVERRGRRDPRRAVRPRQPRRVRRDRSTTPSPRRRAAVDEFRDRRGVDEPLERVDWSAVGRGARRACRSRPPPRRANRRPSRHRRSRCNAPLWVGRCDLTVVVVFHNMQREAARTLHSLARAYQEGIDDLDYEVIVVDNGSDKDQKLGRGARARASGPSSATWASATKAGPSPVRRAQPGHARRSGRRVRPHDRRRPRADAGRPAVRDGRAPDLRPGDRRDPAVVRRARASRATPSRRATTRSSRTCSSIGSSGRRRGTGCSTSATSSASATGSTACGRATACSCRARSSSRPVASTSGSRCPAAASPTSTSTSA